MTAPTETLSIHPNPTLKVVVHHWSPPAGVRPKAAVQIAHGAAEHSLRYGRIAAFLG